MTVNSLKDLDKLITLCRKRGVQSIKVDGIEFHLGAEPRSAKRSAIMAEAFPDIPTITPYTPGGINESTEIVGIDTNIVTDELTEEQLLYYSARPESGESLEGQG